MNNKTIKTRPIRLTVRRGLAFTTIDPRDLITKSAGARLRGMKPPSFDELVDRYPDKLRTIEIGGVEFVRRSQVRRFKTDRQRQREKQERANGNAPGQDTTTTGAAR